MAVAPKAAYGTALKIGDAGSPTETFTEILGARDIQGPTYDMEMIDITNHGGSTNYREWVPSFLSAGEVTATILYDSADTQHALLFTNFAARTLTNWQLVLTDTGAEQHAFSGYIKSLGVGAPLDDAVTLALTVMITGAVTRT